MTTRESPNVRFSEVRHGDDLRRIALRELGDASKWIELVVLNGLRPPYIAASAAIGVLAYGDLIKVPAPSSYVSADADPDAVFGVDVMVTGKNLTVENGDLALVHGVKNFVQALQHHVVVDKRELSFHPKYGCHVRSLLGNVNGPTAAQMAAFYVKSALLQDNRVNSVPSCTAEVLGDQIMVTANVKPVSGRPVDMTLVV